jgi:hypothetical protein
MDESDIRKEQNKEVAASLNDHPKRQTKTSMKLLYVHTIARYEVHYYFKLEKSSKDGFRKDSVNTLSF